MPAETQQQGVQQASDERPRPPAAQPPSAVSVADDDGEPSFEIDFGALVDSFRDAYQYMPMSVERYLLLILVPSSAFGVFLIIAVALLQPPLMVSMPMALLAVFMPFVALVYPKVIQDRHRKEIRERFHLFITHLTVLSTTNINRVEVFRTLAHEKEYAALAEEMGYIVGLIDTWNQSLEDACRMRAKHVPSPLMRDFLERLAYIVGAGQEMSDFLLTEQDSGELGVAGSLR